MKKDNKKGNYHKAIIQKKRNKENKIEENRLK